MNTNLHGVKKVELSEISEIETIGNTYVRHLIVETEEGRFEFVLFSDKRNSVEVETKRIMKI